MDNTLEKKSFMSKFSLKKITHIFWKNRLTKIVSSLLILLLLVLLFFIMFGSKYYLKDNPYISDSGWLSSVEKTAEIILLIGETNIKNGNYKDALFGNDSIYYIPSEEEDISNLQVLGFWAKKGGNKVEFPGLNIFTSESKFQKTNCVQEANYWIGVCYYKLAESTDSVELKVNYLENAIDYLDKGSDSETFDSFRQSQIGDCFSQLGDFDNALKYYQNALKSDSKFIKVDILYKAAEMAKILEKNELAIEYYEEIINEFPTYKYANQINKKIAELLVKE